MDLSNGGLEILKRAEVFIPHEYLDEAGIRTIGIGHVILRNEAFAAMITLDQGMDLLRRDVARFVAAVNQSVTVPLNQHQFDALVIFAFNVGTGAFQSSTLVKRLNQGDYQSVPYELSRWCHDAGKVSKGLIARRAIEARLWDTPAPTDDAGPGTSEVMAQIYAMADSIDRSV